MNQWYQKSRQLIEKLYGEDADLFCDILAATSPRKSVKANWNLAMQIYESHKSGNINYHGCMPCHVNNVNNAIAGLPLSGRKVSNFTANLKGDLNRITVDVWIGRAFGYDVITDETYELIEQAIGLEAKFLGIEPAELQARIWEDTIRANGRKPKSFVDMEDKQLYLWR